MSVDWTTCPLLESNELTPDERLLVALACFVGKALDAAGEDHRPVVEAMIQWAKAKGFADAA
jgi:hypothetical protein